jgi:flagellar motility protein MotE (MotC chaperone)
LIALCERAATHHQSAGRERTAWKDPIDELRANPLVYIDYLEAQNQDLRQRDAWSRPKVEELSQRLQENRRKATENDRALREQLRTAKAETQEALQKYFHEKAIPLRTRLRNEMKRLWSRSRR